MARTLAILGMATSVIATVYAGQIPIGSGLGGVNGLTNGTVTATTTATQASGGKFGEQTYANGGVTAGTTVTLAPPTGGSTLTGDGLTFYMVNDSGAFAADNMWAGTNDSGGVNGNPSTVSTTFTIPIGIFGVTNVGTILNDEYGSTTANVGNGAGVTTTVTFNFGSALTGPGFLGSETFDLVNGTVIRDSFDCTAGTGLSTCQGDNLATTLSSSAYGLNGTVVTPSAAIASVTAANAWSGTYSASTNGPYANTSGSLVLDAQNFYLGSFAGDELFNMVITGTQTGATQSRDELEAVTVLTNGSVAPTPEPSTTILFAVGLLAVGLICKRTRTVRVQ